MADGEIDNLVDEWGEDTVRKAFWLQSHIKRNGLDGIHFMHDEGEGASAEHSMKMLGPGIVRVELKQRMDDSY